MHHATSTAIDVYHSFCSQVQYYDSHMEEGEGSEGPDSDDGEASSPRVVEDVNAPGAVARAAARMPAPPDEEQVRGLRVHVSMGWMLGHVQLHVCLHPLMRSRCVDCGCKCLGGGCWGMCSCMYACTP